MLIWCALVSSALYDFSIHRPWFSLFVDWISYTMLLCKEDSTYLKPVHIDLMESAMKVQDFKLLEGNPFLYSLIMIVVVLWPKVNSKLMKSRNYSKKKQQNNYKTVQATSTHHELWQPAALTNIFCSELSDQRDDITWMYWYSPGIDITSTFMIFSPKSTRGCTYQWLVLINNIKLLSFPDVNLTFSY